MKKRPILAFKKKTVYKERLDLAQFMFNVVQIQIQMMSDLCAYDLANLTSYAWGD